MLYDDIVMPHPDIKAPLTLEYISSHKFALKKTFEKIIVCAVRLISHVSVQFKKLICLDLNSSGVNRSGFYVNMASKITVDGMPP